MTAPRRDALARLAWLDGLALHVRRGMGERPGERRFPGRPDATGIEIESHVAYVPGDDLRHLDWNALGRLDTLLVRRFTAEREVEFHLLLDASASMAVPPEKLQGARELATALAWMALAAGDALRIAVLRPDGPVATPLLRTRARLPEALAAVGGTRPAGTLALGDALAGWAARWARPGAALVVSDLMAEPVVVAHGLGALRARGWEVVLLHVIARAELEPDFERGVLVDAESGATHPMALTAAARARYASLLDAHLAALEAAARDAGAIYARWPTDLALEVFVTRDLARVGLVRRR